MKNKQICPWCGEAITKDDIDTDFHPETKYYERKYYDKRSTESDTTDFNKVVLCKKCHNIIHDNMLLLWKRIYIPFVTIVILLSLPCFYSYLTFLRKHDLASVNRLDIKSSSVFFALPITIVSILLFKLFFSKAKAYTQRYAAYNEYRKPVVFKSFLYAQTSFYPSIPAKQRKKEFVKDNILQISANGKSEYIILTKADFETGKCEATFPVLKKENGLALLEKYSEFELSNGEEVLGTLKIIRRYEE